ncbi:ABC transporter substrate-binding protein [Bacillus sp. Marseille-P3800]|uniref:ABC transporter substrate-binding protein n=1 Tax=Bacillus sp. Marseille-P3800 TaxID=2014782 RepID=UPI000C0762CE|nr:ABC transporter substrate-binding protein [Bacillus sp. Marseille-P3800]
MKWRHLSIVAASSVAIGLAGCSNTETNSSDSVTELQWYMIGTPQPDLNDVMTELNTYTEEEIGIRVKMTQVDWGDYDERMSIITSSGENFDIAFASGGTYTLNAQRGAYMPLNDLLENHGQEMKEVINDALIEGASIDGELYGIPANKEIGQQRVFVFNGNLVEKYDFDVESINGYNDLEPMLAEIKENEPNVTPFPASSTFQPMMPFDYVLGADMPIGFPLTGDTETAINFLETDEAMDVFETMRDFYQKGYIPADAASSNDPWPYNVENWFVRVEEYNPYAELLWERDAGYPIVTQPVNDPIIRNESVTGSLQVVSATSQYPEEAMQFLNLLNTDPYLRNLVNYGIEGTHYEQVDEGIIRDLPERVERYNMPTYALGNHFILDLFENEPEDKWDAFEEFNDSSVPSPILGFHFDPSNVRTEIANLSNVASEFFAPIYTGSVDPEEYVPMAISRLEDAGLEQVIEEVQNQYETWTDTVDE